MTASERLRLMVRGKMARSVCEACGQGKRMSLRDVGEASGSNAPTISRFLNGESIGSDTFDRLSAWVEEAR